MFRFKIRGTTGTIVMPNYKNIDEVLDSENPFTKKLSAAYNYLVLCYAYIELLQQNKFDKDTIMSFFQADTEYWNYDNSGEDQTGIEAAIQEIVNSPAFEKKYALFLDGAANELINVFGAGVGALALDDVMIYDEDEIRNMDSRA